jgi:hypothetical protein
VVTKAAGEPQLRWASEEASYTYHGYTHHGYAYHGYAYHGYTHHGGRAPTRSPDSYYHFLPPTYYYYYYYYYLLPLTTTAYTLRTPYAHPTHTLRTPYVLTTHSLLLPPLLGELVLDLRGRLRADRGERHAPHPHSQGGGRQVHGGLYHPRHAQAVTDATTPALALALTPWPWPSLPVL